MDGFVTEKAGRFASSTKDGSALHTITANMPPVYFRGQAGLLDVALDRNFATNHRIFFVYLRIVDDDTCAHAVDSATLNEEAGTISNVTTIFQAAPFTNRVVSQSGSRIAIDPKDGNLFVSVGDRSTGDPLPLQAQADGYLPGQDDSHHARRQAGARQSGDWRLPAPGRWDIARRKDWPSGPTAGSGKWNMARAAATS